MATRKRKPDAPLLEWLVGGLGAAIFFGMLAMLIASGAGRRDLPPSIHVQVEQVTAVEGGYVLEFIARNDSDVTAADIAIVAELGGEHVQHREARFDYLPPRSERRGGFFFETDPRTGALNLRAEGYNDP